jgi:hypothetical protein
MSRTIYGPDFAKPPTQPGQKLEFIEEAKASGLVRKAFDEMGLTSSQVAPAGMKG